MARKAPKNVCYSRSESCDFRVADAVCVKNDGESSLFNIKKEMDLTCSDHSAAFITSVDKKRRKNKERSQTKRAKLQRHALKKKRNNLRKSKEASEGVKYQTNCGISLNAQKKFKRGFSIERNCFCIDSKKMSKENITYNMLEEIFKDGGEKEIIRLLSVNYLSKKPRVTKNNKVAEKIIRRLESSQNKS